MRNAETKNETKQTITNLTKNETKKTFRINVSEQAQSNQMTKPRFGFSFVELTN